MDFLEIRMQQQQITCHLAKEPTAAELRDDMLALCKLCLEADRWPRPLGSMCAEAWIQKLAEAAKAAIAKLEGSEIAIAKAARTAAGI